MSKSLPTGWHERPILDVVSLPKGQVIPTEEPFRSQVLIAPDHIESKMGRIIAHVTADEQGAISGKYQVEPGDVLLSKIRPALRKVAYSSVSGLCSADIYPLRAGSELDSKYLFAVLLGVRFGRFSESLSGRSGIPKINRKELAEFRILLPPLREQRRIGEILDSVDESIRSTERLIEKTSTVHRAMMDDVFRGLLSDAKASGASSVLLRTCGEAFKLSSGKPWIRATHDRIADDQGVPVYGGNGIVGHCPRALTPARTVIIGRVGENCGATHFADRPAWVTDNALWVRWLHPDFDSEFVFRYLEWFDLRRIQSRTGQPLVTQRGIAAVPIVAPNLKRQTRTTAAIRASQQGIAIARQELEKLRKLKYGLMEDLLTGRVRANVGEEANA